MENLLLPQQMVEELVSSTPCFSWLVTSVERRFGLFIKKNDFLFFFIFFSKSNCHMSYFKWSKRAHLFPLIWLHTQPQWRKIGPFWMLKSCLGLRAASLVPVPRVSLHPSGPVFESRQYIYQNAQNETLSVVQRLVLLNFKLHAKW